jgi:hypothetical protein
MSRRRDRASGRGAEADAREDERGGQSGRAPELSRGAWAPGPVAPNRRPASIPFLAQAGILVAVFAVTTLIAELVGAANLGVSFGIAAITFSIALVVVIVRT